MFDWGKLKHGSPELGMVLHTFFIPTHPYLKTTFQTHIYNLHVHALYIQH